MFVVAKYIVPALLALFLCIALVNGHVTMCHPRQRGAYRGIECPNNLPFPESPIVDYCPHCLNGGGSGTTQNFLGRRGWTPYSPTTGRGRTGKLRAGLCGDRRGNRDHMIGGRYMPYAETPIVAEYQHGSTIDIEISLHASHQGYFQFYICDLEACGTKDIKKKCFGNGHCYTLNRVAIDECQDRNINTTFECGPIHPDYPARWYVPCRKQKDENGVALYGGSSGTMRFQLPGQIQSSRHSVIQSYWVTSNRCNPPNLADYFAEFNHPFGTTCSTDAGGGGFNRWLSTCGGTTVPEEFWACADVAIV